MPEGATVLIANEEFGVSKDRALVFGRSGADGVVGLDATDMGISAVAGSVEWAWSLWFVVNHSRKRPLLLDAGGGGALHRLHCGHRHAVNVPRLSILVPGLVYTHRLELIVPAADLADPPSARSFSGTIDGGITLSDRDRDVMVALLSGYLQSFPRRHPHPRTYQEVAALLGPPWTKTTVRKQVERLKDRLARTGAYFDGPQANYDLADYLMDNGLLSPADLERWEVRP